MGMKTSVIPYLSFPIHIIVTKNKKRELKYNYNFD
jgi:hypothetical protein